MEMKLLDERVLVRRLVRAFEEGGKVVFLVGSPLTAPESLNAPGVPNVKGMIELIRSELGRDESELDNVDLSNLGTAYQSAFETLRRFCGLDAVNRVVRRAVMMARIDRDEKDILHKIITNPHMELCERIQYDQNRWYLRDGVAALGAILANYPRTFGQVVLTTNFDPLIEVAVEREFGRVFSTALHGDGSLAFTYGNGCHVVHLHGFWFGTDTLHTPDQLSHDRPHLVNSIKRLIAERIVVVLAYGGWDDVFTRAIAQIARDNEAYPEILWTFFSKNLTDITQTNGSLLELLEPSYSRGRVALYGGVNVQTFFPLLLKELESSKPSETLDLYLKNMKRRSEQYDYEPKI